MVSVKGGQMDTAFAADEYENRMAKLRKTLQDEEDSTAGKKNDDRVLTEAKDDLGHHWKQAQERTKNLQVEYDKMLSSNGKGKGK